MQGLPQKLVEVVNQMQGGMQEKGQEIEHQKNLSQMLGTMAEVVFDVVAFAFQNVDTFVLNLATGAGKVTHICNVAGREGVVGEPTKVKRSDPFHFGVLVRQMSHLVCFSP